MQFVHQALTWGFLLALVPLLIHLINMMRHRRVRWAAMEFLLASYKKHRKWIWLKQLLLLASRMAAVALVVAMLAQLKTREQWLAFFGGRATHHYVLLDDSYSMSDRVAGASAMDAAKQVLATIVRQATQQDSPQKLTLIRYSQARGAASALRRPADGTSRSPATTRSGPPGETSEDKTTLAAPAGPATVDQLADFNAEPIDPDFDITLERRLNTIDATQLAVGPLDALGLVRQLLSQAQDETSIVYLVSDFRAKDWNSPAELRDALGQIRRLQAEIHLVNCARSTEPNLGVVAIEPADETRAAGVPLFVNIQVKNFGARPAAKVQLKVQQTFYPPQDLTRVPPEELRGQTEDLATLLIEQIGPGETITRRVQVYFPQPGKHLVEAVLPDDPVETDNRRYCVIDFPEGEPVLIVDGSDDEQNAYFLQAAFRPLERSNTGIRPDVKPVSFLRDVTLETLNAYSAIYLLDVSRLDGRAVQTLEDYVRGGGGLAIFAGPTMNTGFYNEALYKEGGGLLPAPLALDYELPPPLDPSEPDVELSNHPIFAFFQSQTNPLIRGVKIARYRKVAEGWKPGSGQAVEVIARVRDSSPLVVEKKFGQGTVLLFLTTLEPRWNDWAKNPAFVVVALKMQSYLATAKRLDDPRLVGTPLELHLESALYRPDLAFVVPGEKPGTRLKIERRAQPGANQPPEEPGPRSQDHGGTESADVEPSTLTASLGRALVEGRLRGETDRAGVYEAWPMTTKGEIELKRWALNVDPDEGDLTPLPWDDLRSRLDPLKVSYHAADQYQQDEVASTGYNLSSLILFGLILLLIGEQALAYSASYHVVPGAIR